MIEKYDKNGNIIECDISTSELNLTKEEEADLNKEILEKVHKVKKGV